VKVLDLGMAHAFGRRRIDGGTPGYMAPEQRRGAPEDERTDVYARRRAADREWLEAVAPAAAARRAGRPPRWERSSPGCSPTTR
jgi:eukaryotic-like serine/threonine-protein kinase